MQSISKYISEQLGPTPRHAADITIGALSFDNRLPSWPRCLALDSRILASARNRALEREMHTMRSSLFAGTTAPSTRSCSGPPARRRRRRGDRARRLSAVTRPPVSRGPRRRQGRRRSTHSTRGAVARGGFSVQMIIDMITLQTEGLRWGSTNSYLVCFRYPTTSKSVVQYEQRK